MGVFFISCNSPAQNMKYQGKTKVFPRLQLNIWEDFSIWSYSSVISAKIASTRFEKMQKINKMGVFFISRNSPTQNMNVQGWNQGFS